MRPFRKVALYPFAALVCLFLTHFAQAQQEPVYTYALIGDSIKVGKSITVLDTVFFNTMLKPSILRTSAVNNVLSLRINESTGQIMPDSFRVTLKVSAVYTDKNNLVDTVKEKMFSVDYNRNNTYKSRDVFFLQGAYSMQLKILDISIEYAPSSVVIPLLTLENKIQVDRDYVMNPVVNGSMSCTPNAVKKVNYEGSTVAEYGELKITWTPNRVSEAYDVEWTYIDKTALDNGRYLSAGRLDPQLIFKNNASRITTKAAFCQVPLLYDGEGSLFYRVRGVQQNPDGELLYTAWSSDFINEGGLGRYDFTGHERTLNWQATTTFAEEGKRKSVVQYFDGSLRNRQTVTRDNTTETTIVAETLYDHQGRPVIQVMPAPTLNKLIGFTPNFNKADINSGEYDKNAYDPLQTASNYCDKGAGAMSTSSGAAQYYSTDNPEKDNGVHQFIPDAKGYVFTETQYTQDNTGRIYRQGGVGRDFQIGSDHETRYYYGTPEQTDLDALFGTEAGDASHYQKNMVRDANGQYSVSYVDMHGRAVATALAGKEPENLMRLSTYRDSIQTESLLSPSNNLLKGTSVELSKSLLVTKAGPHIFRYDLGATSMTMDDCQKKKICYDCLYDLTITISDDCNNQQFGGSPKVISKSNFKLFEIDTVCSVVHPLNIEFSQMLNEGSYNITKTLSISQEGLQYYQDNIYLKQNTCLTYEEVLRQQLDVIRQRMTDCDQGTEDMATLHMYREQMMEDLTPGIGQYADPDIIPDVTPGCTGFSIFNTFDATGKKIWQDPALQYRDEEGKLDFVDVNGVPTKPNDLDQQTYIDNFQQSWAEALLERHPEFKYYQQYEKYADSHLWDEDFRKTDTYEQAIKKGYLNPLASTFSPASQFSAGSDPLYTAHHLSVFKTEMENYMQQPFAGVDSRLKGISLWSVTTVLSKCTEPIDNSCTNFYSLPSNVFNNQLLCVGDLDMAWRIFRDMYLDKKQLWLDQFIRSQIGVQPYPCKPLVPVFPIQEKVKSEEGLVANASSEADGKNIADARLKAMVEENCKAYTKRWLDQLGACNYTEAQSNTILQELIEVCKEGGDEQHIMGASTVKPASTHKFRSFDEVIRYYNAQWGIADNNCNAYLIDKPLPNNQPMFRVQKPLWSKPENCECEKLNALFNQYSNVAGNYNNFSDYLQKKWNTHISQSALDSLRGLCSGTINCKYIPQPIYLPFALQCNTGEICIDCSQFKQAYDSFKVRFPSLVPTFTEEDEVQQQINRIFANYLNQKFGFNYTAADYLNFSAGCDSMKTVLGTNATTDTTLLKLAEASCAQVVVPSTGTNRPYNISCEQLITTYKNFLADFPYPEKGATVKVYKEADNNVPLSLADAPAMSIMQEKETADNLSIAVSALSNTQVSVLAMPDSIIAPLPDSIQAFSKSSVQTLSKSYGFNTLSASGTMMLAAPPNRILVDSLLSGKALFEWYFNTNFKTSGYSYEQFMDWMVNGCGYKLRQLPFSDEVEACCDTLQTLFNDFLRKYPQNGGASITETKVVPVQKINHLLQYYNYYGQVVQEATGPSAGALAAMVWTNGSWFKLRENVGFNFNVLPQNATINSAALNLYAKPEHVEFYPCCGAHYRKGTDSVYGIFERLDGPVIPNQTLWSNLPSTSPINALTLVPVSGNGTGDVFSNQDYLNQSCTGLIQDLYTSAQENQNYGLLFRLNLENLGYKGYTFWGITAQTPVGKMPYLSVNYTAARCDVFTAFINNALGTHLNLEQIRSLYNQCGIPLDVCPKPEYDPVFTLCGKAEPMDEIVQLDADECADSLQIATVLATERYRLYVDSLNNNFREAYSQKCLNILDLESFTVSHPVSEYHYTLYYYDQAGNLVKTISPEGVHPNRNSAWLQQVAQKRKLGERLVPEHGLPAVYRYNSLNAVVSQSTPDAGLSRFWYDRLGRLVVSQNAQQKLEGSFSYTRYDGLGRVTEVGKKPQPSVMTNALARNSNQLAAWFGYTYTGTDGQRLMAEEVTQTIYDFKDLTPQLTQGVAGVVPVNQKEYTLRNRVSYTRYFNRLLVKRVGGNLTIYTPRYEEFESSTTYGYDIHGNVDTLLQTYRTGVMASHSGNRFKTIAYKYDLVSGKVNEVHYQPGLSDALYHRYSYDGDNRLTDVYTTDNKSLIGDRDLEEHEARYLYYKHGPLAKAVIGHQQVQGLDYAYTLQGWFKGVNSIGASQQQDMGGDGLLVAKDAFGFSLNYFTGDYNPIGTGVNPFPGHSAFLDANAYKPLYNGNISSMAVSIDKLGATQLYNYRYDQLNRLTGMDVYRGFDAQNNTWLGLSTTEDYKEQVTYDGNGNILSYLRNGAEREKGLPMDDLKYSYNRDAAGQLLNNRLRHVKDEVIASLYTEDLEGQKNDNYIYDAIGNLVHDEAENIEKIEWNVYGKIRNILKNDGTSITYSYDASGNRISKQVSKVGSGAATTWYVRDAQGNVMAVYEEKGGKLNLTEQHLYGSARLGLWIRNIDMDVVPTASNISLLGPVTVGTLQRGWKRYELSNHLGNVLAVMSDKKNAVPSQPNSSLIDHYEADVVSVQDYYSFGMQMPGRMVASGMYRYGFNGKENDNEVKGTGNQIDYGERIYDPRIGRFLSTDPLSRSFPWYTPYQYAGNNPILFIDIDGLEPITPEQLKRTVTWLVSNKPMYIGNFKRIHYELFTRRVYYGEGSLNISEQNILRGAVGEVVFAGRATVGFLPYNRTTYSFNKNQSSISSLRHDVKLTLTPIRAAQKPGERGVTEPFTKSRMTWDPAIEFNNADGSTYKYLTDKKNQTTLYVEVKTLGQNSYNFTNIVDGFDQAIKTATTLKGQKNSLSVLAVDSDAYMNAIKDPAQLGILTEKLSELKLAGGHLMLINNQYKKTEKEINGATEKAKDN
ncbi:hypothetical protein OCK74_12175 [Chitinophagaceae bacterium LB-8]|uniref:DUF6443 domain-containing protein n=1 Tax=Paraflavisolibacter caeni TaxID=2982496 RepID=A0A9X3BFY3_9BACT|nr:RHS repeat-associated core domain-containing protein [Paraflavisolibacter caeni]MCU7549879.1 hypothetical protein [Paraflavisolibacter caeni]